MRLRTALKICREFVGVPWESRERRKHRVNLNRTLPQIRKAMNVAASKWKDLRFPLVQESDGELVGEGAKE